MYWCINQQTFTQHLMTTLDFVRRSLERSFHHCFWTVDLLRQLRSQCTKSKRDISNRSQSKDVLLEHRVKKQIH